MDAYRSESLAHRVLTQQLIGQFFDVYHELGGGFAESVYAHALEIALRDAGIRYERERPVTIRFRDQVVGIGRPDFIVGEMVIVECKAVSAIEPWQRGQVLHYLRASGMPVGLLLNFGPRPEIKRIVAAPKGNIRDHGHRGPDRTAP